MAQAVRTARLACGLTQEQLGRRLGFKGRAVYRWESASSAPRKRHRRELVTAITAVNATVAATLAAAFASEARGAPGAVTPPTPAPSPIDTRAVFERAVLDFADELDVPARRARTALTKLAKRLRGVNITVEQAEQYLTEWNDGTAP